MTIVSGYANFDAALTKVTATLHSCTKVGAWVMSGGAHLAMHLVRAVCADAA